MFTNVNRPSAVDVLRPFAIGDQFYADTTTTLAKQAVGTTGQVQTVAGGIPAWSFSFKATAITAATSAGVLIENSNGDDVALFGAGPGTGVTFYGGVVFSGTLSVIDTNFSIIGSADATKAIKFEVDGQTANDTLTIDTGAQTDSRTATFPVMTGNSVLTLSNATLTSARVPYATTNGILTDSANLTFGSSSTVLGIRRTPHTWGSLYGGVEMQASAMAEYYAVGNIQMNWLGNAYDSGAGAFKYTNTDSAAAFRCLPSSRLFLWNTAASGSADAAITFSESMRLDHTLLTVTVPVLVNSTTDSTSKDTGSIITEGGIGAEKSIVAGGNLFAAQAVHAGVSSTVTAAGTTTLTTTSRRTQIFTGTTTQTLQLPAANVFGAGVGVEYIVVNRSTGTVTAQRAGSDTFDGGGTTDAILTNTTRHYVSNGSNQWHTIA